MRVYISGPITGLPDLNLGAFRNAALAFTLAGHRPVVPHDLVEPHWSWEQCMRADLGALLCCDAMYLLDGWADSKGAVIERKVAEALGMPIYRRLPKVKTGGYLDPDNPRPEQPLEELTS